MTINTLTTFYIIRHGETEYNVRGIMQGNTIDSPLTPRGREQAQDLAQLLSQIHFDYIFSSDLLRAKRTADIIAFERKLAVKTTQVLREQSYGRYEGKPSSLFQEELKELLKTYESLKDEDRMHFRIQEDMETDAQVASRFITFLREIAVAYPGKTIAVVSHSDAIRYFLIHIGFATYEVLPDGSIDNCSYVKVQSDGVDFFVIEARGVRKKTIDGKA